MRYEMIAILRGIRSDEVVKVAAEIFDSGFDAVEVPLNSPDAIESIRRLVERFPEQLIGAGTVLDANAVCQVASVGGQLIVAPNCDVAVIREAKQRNLKMYPGVMTPTESFAALQAGADALKIFPGDLLGAGGVKAIKAVLPRCTKIIVVGAVDLGNLEEWAAAGVYGFGIGSAIYKPGNTPDEVRVKAQDFMDAISRL
jgi:2-dehydro-3-deoxyphosphogalactonate aldolase